MTTRHVLLVALTAALSAGAEHVNPAATGQGWERRHDLLAAGLDDVDVTGLPMCGPPTRADREEPDEWRCRADGQGAKAAS